VTRRRVVALLVALALYAVGHEVAAGMRAERPPAPEANRFGVGRLLGGVLTGSFRPLLLNYAWMRSDILYGEGRWDELQVLYRSMLALYPDNRRAREFLGWHLAFNLKNEAFDPELGWRYAREGLEILMGTRSGARRLYSDPLVDWFWHQCGQNPLPPLQMLRYAGPQWEAEKKLRIHARDWAKEHWGERLGRFEIALRLLEGSSRWVDRVARAELLRRQVIEDWLAKGSSARFPEAVEAQRWLATPEGLGDLPGDAPGSLERRARVFEELGRDEVRDEVLAQADAVDYDLAISLLALGAHRRDLHRLRLAEAAFALLASGGSDFAEERTMVARWIAFVEGGGRGERPRLPFDGIA